MCEYRQPITKVKGRNRTLFEQSFFNEGARIFNSIDRSIKDINVSNCSLISFKNKLDKYLLKIPDPPPVDGYQSIYERNSIPIIIKHSEFKRQRTLFGE